MLRGHGGLREGERRRGMSRNCILPNNSFVENVGPLESLCSQWLPLQAQVLTNAEE